MSKTWKKRLGWTHTTWKKTVDLGDGYKLRAVLSNYRDLKEYYNFGIFAFRGRFAPLLVKWGKSTGPGLSVVGPALKMLEESEDIARGRAKQFHPTFLTITAETNKLFLIYRKVLAKRGYYEEDWNWGPTLTKRLGKGLNMECECDVDFRCGNHEEVSVGEWVRILGITPRSFLAQDAYDGGYKGEYAGGWDLD